MNTERYPIARLVDGSGLGVVRSLGTYYSIIEFNEYGHTWRIAVDNDEFEIIDYVSIGRETVE